MNDTLSMAATPRRRTPITWRRIQTFLLDILWYIVIILLAFAVMLPFIWMIVTSLKGQTEVFAYPPTWIPKDPQWQNYVTMWKEAPFAVLFPEQHDRRIGCHSGSGHILYPGCVCICQDGIQRQEFDVHDFFEHHHDFQPGDPGAHLPHHGCIELDRPLPGIDCPLPGKRLWCVHDLAGISSHSKRTRRSSKTGWLRTFSLFNPDSFAFVQTHIGLPGPVRIHGQLEFVPVAINHNQQRFDANPPDWVALFCKR